MRNCVNIRSRQTKARDNTLATIEKIIAENNLLDNKILIVCIPSSIHVEKNLTGLIANQLMSKYQRPVLLLNETIQTEYAENAYGTKLLSFDYITWEGSARGYDKSALSDFRKFCVDSGCIDYAEGHANAFGFGINNSKIKEFIDYCNTTLESFEFTPCYDVDFIFNADNFNGKDILEIAELKSLWGQGVDEPYIALTNVRVSKGNTILMSPDKSPTIKIKLPNGVELIKFKATQEEYNSLTGEGYLILDIVGRCESNSWGGRMTPQILIDDYEITNAV